MATPAAIGFETFGNASSEMMVAPPDYAPIGYEPTPQVDPLERFCFSLKKCNALIYCYVAFPDAKPEATFAGNALGRVYRIICHTDSDLSFGDIADLEGRRLRSITGFEYAPFEGSGVELELAE